MTELLKLNQIPWSMRPAGDLARRDKLLVAEDAFGAGCVGQRVAAILAQHGQAPEKLVLINLGKTFLPEGPCPSWSIRQASTPRASPGRYRRRVHE